jgi:N-alpha-acetyltransferase 15/16, NatA auxiliary subunit
LKKYPTHFETLGLKGLVLQGMGKLDEGYECIKKALIDSEMKNANCFQIYGIMYKNDKKYTLAAKSYQNALKITPENFNLLRDLATLQCQTRDYKQLIKTRELILKAKKDSQNWVSYATAFYLLPNYEWANKIMDSFLKDFDEVK